MKSFSRYTFSVLALLLYVGGNALIEATHHDVANILLHSKPVLESHDCTGTEIHLSAESTQHCLACSYFAQRLSTETHPLILNTANVIVALVRLHPDETIEIDVLHSGKRGPPTFS